MANEVGKRCAREAADEHIMSVKRAAYLAPKHTRPAQERGDPFSSASVRPCVPHRHYNAQVPASRHLSPRN